MIKPSLDQGTTKNLKAKAIAFAVILLFSFLTAYFFNAYSPSYFSTKILFRVITTDNDLADVFPSLTEAAVSEKDFLAALRKSSEFSPGKHENISVVSTGRGSATVAMSSKDPYKLEKSVDEFVRIATDKVYYKINNIRKLENDALLQKLALIDKNILETTTLLEKLNTPASTDLSLPQNAQIIKKNEITELKLNIAQLKDKIALAESKLSATPKNTISQTIVSSSPAKIKKLQNELTDEQEQLRILFRTYKEKHPRVIEKTQNIKALEKELAKQTKNIVKSSPNREYERLKQLIKHDSALLAQFEKRLVDLQKSEKQALETVIEKKAELSEQYFETESKLETFKNLKLATQNELEILKVKHETVKFSIESNKQKREMYQKIGHDPRLSYLICFATALILGFFLFTKTAEIKPKTQEITAELPDIKEPTADTVEPSHIEIPDVEEPTADIDEPTHNEKPIIFGDSEPLIPKTLKFEYPQNETVCDGRLFSINEPNSELYRLYEKLTETIQVKTAQSGIRVLVPIASKPKIGQSTWVANLGVMLAKQGYTVLLIDSNHYGPALHKIFDLPNKVGVLEVLNGENIINATQKTETPDLHLLSYGKSPDISGDSSEYTEKFNRLVNIARRRADIIIVDSPYLETEQDIVRISDPSFGFIYLADTSDKEISPKVANINLMGYLVI